MEKWITTLKKALLIICWCGLCYMIPSLLGKLGNSELLMFCGGMVYLGGMHIYEEADNRYERIRNDKILSR